MCLLCRGGKILRELAGDVCLREKDYANERNLLHLSAQNGHLNFLRTFTSPWHDYVDTRYVFKQFSKSQF